MQGKSLRDLTRIVYVLDITLLRDKCVHFIILLVWNVPKNKLAMGMDLEVLLLVNILNTSMGVCKDPDVSVVINNFKTSQECVN